MSDGLQALGIPAEEQLVAACARFLRLLEEANRSFNLTSIRQLPDMVPLHLLDSLTVRPFLHGERVLDVGTGAGLPGLPLALVEPDRQFTLIDGTAKKIRFVAAAIAALGLRNASAEQQRAELYRPAPLFDTVLCRAVSTLGAFVQTAGHLVAAGGRLVAMKGRRPDDELATTRLAGWQAPEVTRVQVPGLAAERHIVVLRRNVRRASQP